MMDYDYNRMEFHRNAVALMPDPADKHPGIAMMVDAPMGRVPQRFCTCNQPGAGTCAHLRQLFGIYEGLKKDPHHTNFEENFKKSIWYDLLVVLVGGCRETPVSVTLRAGGKAMQSICRWWVAGRHFCSPIFLLARIFHGLWNAAWFWRMKRRCPPGATDCHVGPFDLDRQ